MRNRWIVNNCWENWIGIWGKKHHVRALPHVNSRQIYYRHKCKGKITGRIKDEQWFTQSWNKKHIFSMKIKKPSSPGHCQNNSKINGKQSCGTNTLAACGCTPYPKI